MPDTASGPSVPRARRRTALLAGGALAAVAALTAGFLAAGGSGTGQHPAKAADGLRHTTVEVTSAACGRGWTHPEPGRQVFDLRNTSGSAAEVYLTDAKKGAV